MGNGSALRLYDGDGDALVRSSAAIDKVTLLPPGKSELGAEAYRLRILWGQDLLRDILDGRYRSVICAVNDTDNSHGIIAQIVDLMPTSQWTAASVTSYAKLFHDSVSLHASGDREPYILKFDLDRLLVLAMLRPRNKDHFGLDDLERGFATATKMLKGRMERQPVASVCFLGGRANRVQDSSGAEPSFERVLKIMHESGYRGDVYAAPKMWESGEVAVFPSYPFPPSLEKMRGGSS
ncbi:MAG: hypothetical protein ACF8GE_07305 [Phycisphaerales bacterium JB043]